MSHFAKVIDGVITEVIVATQEEINSERHGDAFLWVQTSYNKSFRKNFAVVGGIYDMPNDVFVSIKPFDSWVLNTTSYEWEPPVESGNDGTYIWNEDTLAWDQLEETS
jgi:hypothetical protein